MSTASDDGTETYAFALEKHSMVAMTTLLVSYVLVFVFSITSLISACVAADIFVKYLPHLMVNEKNQLPYVIMITWRLMLFALEKHSMSASSSAPKGGKRASTCDDFSF